MIMFLGNTTALIVPICFFCLGLFVFLKNKSSKLHRAFFAYFLSLSAWGIGVFGMVTSRMESQAYMWVHILNVGVVFLPSGLLYFIENYLTSKNKILSLVRRSSLIFSTVALASSFTTLFTRSVKKLPYGYIADPGPAFGLFVLIAVGLLVYGHVELYKDYIAANGHRKNQTRYLFLGTAIFIAGELIVVPSIFNIVIFSGFPFWNLTSIIYAIILTYTIVKYQLLDIKIAVTRAGVFLFVYSLTLGLPFWYGFKMGKWLVVSIAMAVLATAGPFIFIILKEKAENILLAQQKKYQNILLQASGGMVRQYDLGKLLKLTVYIIKKAVNISFAAIFLYNKENNKYELKVIRESEPSDIITIFNTEHPLIKYMMSEKDPFTYEELPQNIKDSFASEPGALIVPSFADKKLIGFIVLGKKLNKAAYSQEDINVFKTLSNQMALAIENCMHIIESNETRERLFAAEKLASIGGMAEGISHQIMNRMGHFIMNADLIKKKMDALNQTADALTVSMPVVVLKDVTRLSESITNSTRQMADMLRGVLNFAKIEVTEQDYSVFHLNDIVNPALELLRVKHHPERIPLEIETNKEGGLVHGLKSHLMEALYNILDNAYEATREKKDYLKNNRVENPGDYIPAIKVRLCCDKDKTTIEVSDNGIGIKEESKRKIFAPFYSTKSTNKSGSGIGMYTVKRLIEEAHKGKVHFESEYLKGTVIRMHLPTI